MDTTPADGPVAARPPEPEARRTWAPGRPVDVHATLGPLRRGAGDPTWRRLPDGLATAWRTPAGAATAWIFRWRVIRCSPKRVVTSTRSAQPSRWVWKGFTTVIPSWCRCTTG